MRAARRGHAPPQDSAPAWRRITRPELAAVYLKLFEPLVRRVQWRRGLLKEDADDVVQEAFVLAISKMKVGANATATVWLARVADRLALNRRKTDRRRKELLAQWGSRGERYEEPLDGGPRASGEYPET